MNKFGTSAARALNTLRLKLTVQTFVVFGLVLVVLSGILLSFAESQWHRSAENDLLNRLAYVTTYLRSESVIKDTWIFQQEVSNQAVLWLSDGGHPFHYKGAWQTETDRDVLLQRAKQIAADNGLDAESIPSGFPLEQQITFPMEGDHADTYLVGVWTLSSNSGWQSLIYIKDLRSEQAKIHNLRIICLVLLVTGCCVQLLLSWWISGKSSRPVLRAFQKQVEFVAAASHELKSPLAVLSASTAALGISEENDTALKSSIQRECSRMGQLIQDLLLLAQNDAGSWKVELGTVNLDDLFSELLARFSLITAQKHQQLRFDLPEENLPDIPGDFQRLVQLLSILLDNACSYTQEYGRITVSARMGKRSLTISVADNGPIIPPEHRERIFERFYRADSSRKSSGHSGLGLSIAQELAHLHRGRLYLDTQAAETTFSLELPLR